MKLVFLNRKQQQIWYVFVHDPDVRYIEMVLSLLEDYVQQTYIHWPAIIQFTVMV